MIVVTCLGIALSQPDLRHTDEFHIRNQSFVRIEGRANSSTYGRQQEASLASTEEGLFAICWENLRSKQGQPSVLSAKFSSLGSLLVSETSLSQNTGHPSQKPSLVMASNGEYHASFESRFRDQRELAAYVGDKRVSSSIGQSYDINTAMASNGLWVATWVAEVGDNATRTFAQVFDKSGNPIGTEVRLSKFKSGRDVLPSVVATDAGFAVVWQRFDSQNHTSGLFGQLINFEGELVGTNIAVAGATALEPSLAKTPYGFAVAWNENTATGSAVRFKYLDNRLSPTSQAISVSNQSLRQNAAAIATDTNGQTVVAWNSYKNEEADIYAQLFDSKGVASGPAFLTTKAQKGSQTLANSSKQRLAFDRNGITVVWSGQGGIGDSTGVYFTRILPSSAVDSEKKKNLLELNSDFAEMNKLSEKVVLKLDKVGVVNTAGPHEPPISDFKKVVNPWGVQFPSANGGFVGHSQTSFTPPDMNIAVGNENVVVTVNDGISIFTKNGTRTYTNNMRQTNGFWGNLAASDNFIYDPECFYDRLTGRYWVMATQGAGTSADSAALVAVSDDSDPNGVWYTYKFLATSLAGNFFDSPNFGVDGGVLYVTGDGFGIGSNYPVFCIDKAPMLTGGTPSFIRSATLPTSTQSAGIPAVQDSGNAYYMVEHKEAGNNTGIDLIALQNPTTAPSFTRFTLTVPSYNSPESPPQSGSTTRVNAFDARMWNVRFRDGYVWATHHVNNARVRGRWYQIDPRGWPTSGNNPTIVQSGEIDLGSTIRTFFPALDVDEQGNMGITYSRSSTTEFYSASHSIRKFDDASGTTQGHTIDMSATGPYSGNRWGDYNGCSADPGYPGMFWGCAEIANGNSWQAWVQPYYATNELWANALNTFSGQKIAGDLSSLLKDDGTNLVHKSSIRIQQSDPYIGYELRTRTFRTGQTSGAVKLVYRVDAPGYVISTQLLDHTTNTWVTLDSRPASTIKNTLDIAVANPTNYVRPSDGRIFYRLRIDAGGGPVGANTIQLFADRWAWIEN